MHHLKFLAVSKVGAVRPGHLAEFVHLSEASAVRFADGKIKLRTVDNRLAAGAICRIMNCCRYRSAELKKLRVGRRNVLKTGTVSVSTGGASAQEAQPHLCLALGVATNSPPWAASLGPAIA